MLSKFRRVTGMLIFLALWESSSAFGLVSPQYLPRLTQVGGAMLDFLQADLFWRSATASISRTLLGLVVAVVLAMILAIIAGRYPLVRRALEPLADILRSLPPPALVPMLIFVLGIGSPLYYFVVIYGCMWATYVAAANALATAEPVQVNTARSFGLSEWQIMWSVRLPAAMPEIFTGIRLSGAIALLATIGTEMLLGGGGLGALLYNTGFSLLWAQMYALLFFVGLLGIAINSAIMALRWALVSWADRYAAMGAFA